MATTELRARALRCLARREHSRAELARKLAGHGDAAEVDAVLVRMSELGLQSDSRFAEAWVRGKAARFGSARLRRELSQRGLEAELIDDALAGADLEPELERARALWRTRFGSAPGNAREWARQARFLQSRGFSTDVIRKLLKEPDDEPA